MLMTTDPGDLVLDPTCGSGTTAYVAEAWGRRWITCDSSRVALALAKHRLMTAKFDYYQLRELSAEDVARNPHGTWIAELNEEGRPTGRQVDLSNARRCLTSRSRASPATPRSIPSSPNTSRILSGKAEGAEREPARRFRSQLKEKLVEKLIQKHRQEGANAVTDADKRRWLLPDTPPGLIRSCPAKKPLKGVTPKQVERYRAAIPKGEWKEWEVPFDTDPDWPKPLQDALTAYRAAWRAKMDEVNAVISANAEREELVDRPDPVKDVVRVTGPFSMEGVIARDRGRPRIRRSAAHLRSSRPSMESAAAVQERSRRTWTRSSVCLKTSGVDFPGNKNMKFSPA